MNVLIDTNVLLRIENGPRDPNYQLAFDALEYARGQGHVPCLVPQIIYEFWVVATRPTNVNGYGLTAADAMKSVATFDTPYFHLFRDERAIFEQWMQLVHRYQVVGKPTHDLSLIHI